MFILRLVNDPTRGLPSRNSVQDDLYVAHFSYVYISHTVSYATRKLDARRRPSYNCHMTYHVYENFIHDRVRVHKSACVFCKHGEGLFGGQRRPSGQWHGPFTDASSAFAKARSLRRKDTAPCATCSPVP